MMGVTALYYIFDHIHAHVYNPANKEYMERNSEQIRELIRLYRDKEIETIEKEYAGRKIVFCYKLLDENWRLICSTEIFDDTTDNTVCFRKVIRRTEKPNGDVCFRHIRDDKETITLGGSVINGIRDIIRKGSDAFRADGYHADESCTLDGYCCDVILSDGENIYYFEKIDLWVTLDSGQSVNQPVVSLIEEVFALLRSQGVDPRYYEKTDRRTHSYEE